MADTGRRKGTGRRKRQPSVPGYNQAKQLNYLLNTAERIGVPIAQRAPRRATLERAQRAARYVVAQTRPARLGAESPSAPIRLAIERSRETGEPVDRRKALRALRYTALGLGFGGILGPVGGGIASQLFGATRGATAAGYAVGRSVGWGASALLHELRSRRYYSAPDDKSGTGAGAAG